MMTRHALLAAGTAFAVAVAGCAATQRPGGATATSPATVPPHSSIEANPPGDIPDNQVFVGFTATDGSFAVKYPEGWARTDSGSTVAFGEAFNSITVSGHDGFYQPTEDYARSVEVPQIATRTPGFTPGHVSTVQRPAGTVVLITYQQDSPPSSVTGKSIRQDVERYEYSRDGRGVALTLAAPTGSDTTDAWHTVTDSFTWLR
ncbi:hypothetical protein ACP6C3_31000 [Mycolicibacterium septicum]|jgi:hypothetical protein|uniref:Lipoprotein n=3 Tax=Mycolicibacterium TaxID=1866885 RepID=A0A378V2Z5_MYCFO|nr:MULTISPECIES: hypothetical protein [Mycolicibacterium]KMV18355.1 hypothetical protein ACT17_12095 [Mycolicibacterium conceptionense]MCA4727454.1 hypothetical protein [Mycolicibacterium fortuitum]SUA04774.1 Uncharacterised protein [Mycolicibacterium fortuitum]